MTTETPEVDRDDTEEIQDLIRGGMLDLRDQANDLAERAKSVASKADRLLSIQEELINKRRRSWYTSAGIVIMLPMIVLNGSPAARPITPMTPVQTEVIKVTSRDMTAAALMADGITLASQRKYEAAAITYASVHHEYGPNPESLAKAADCLLHHKDYNQAYATASEAIRLHDQSGLAHLVRGLVCLQDPKRKPADAKAEFVKGAALGNQAAVARLSALIPEKK